MDQVQGPPARVEAPELCLRVTTGHIAMSSNHLYTDLPDIFPNNSHKTAIIGEQTLHWTKDSILISFALHYYYLLILDENQYLVGIFSIFSCLSNEIEHV